MNMQRFDMCTAGLAVLVCLSLAAASTPAYAQNPCKSEDPLDFDEELRRADCGEPADLRGWEPEIADGDASAVGGGQSEDYSYLPTTFSGWYNGLSAADKQKFNARLVEEAGVGDRQLSQREIDALLTLVSTEMDSYFASEELTADQRRRAIAEIAVQSGVGLDNKRGNAADEAIFGRDDDYEYDYDYDYDYGYENQDSGFDGWQPLDPTEDFGLPDDGAVNSDIDLEGF